MYEPFKFDQLMRDQLMKESFDLSLDRQDPLTSVFTEAYFIDGKKTLKPVDEAFQHLKDRLKLELAEKKSKFNAKEFCKQLDFKELEDALRQVFGFRNIDIYPSNETYDSKRNKFSSDDMNCTTWTTWRYPIDGLVTDKGFYDGTNSINTTLEITLGLLHRIEAEECTAVLLHEIGHNIDPALVDIQYTTTNVYSKYLTDREDKITDKEKKITKGQKLGFIELIVIVGMVALASIISAISNFFANLNFNKEKALKKIKEQLAKDSRFSRQTNQEAFADNLARMYGYGPALARASSKMDKDLDKKMKSWYKKEKARQRAIANVTQYCIADVHKTDIHRIHSMIREYEADLKDPSVPAEVKKYIKADLEEVKKVLDYFLNNKDDFKKRVNQLIYQELKEADIELGDGETKVDKTAKRTKQELNRVIKESFAVGN